jgi:hypothetical protein
MCNNVVSDNLKRRLPVVPIRLNTGHYFSVCILINHASKSYPNCVGLYLRNCLYSSSNLARNEHSILHTKNPGLVSRGYWCPTLELHNYLQAYCSYSLPPWHTQRSMHRNSVCAPFLYSIVTFYNHCMYSFGYFPGVRLWFADDSEPTVSSIFKGWV